MILSHDTYLTVSLFIDGEHEAGGGHDAPEWSRTVCVVILIVSTLLLALVSEELVSAIQPTLEASGITQAFMVSCMCLCM